MSEGKSQTTEPLRGGLTRKGGTNAAESQIKGRPASPEPLRQTPLPTSVPWPATDDKSGYIAKLRREAGRHRREVARLTNIIPEMIAEAERIEALAKELDSQW